MKPLWTISALASLVADAARRQAGRGPARDRELQSELAAFLSDLADAAPRLGDRKARRLLHRALTVGGLVWRASDPEFLANLRRQLNAAT